MKADNLITKIQDDELSEALSLVWNVFLGFEAPEYCNEGVAEFKRYIELDAMREKLDKGELKMWVCKNEGRVTGVIALRPPAISACCLWTGIITIKALHGRCLSMYWALRKQKVCTKK